jgi:hypothetical protein
MLGTGAALRKVPVAGLEGRPQKTALFWSPGSDLRAILGLLMGSWLNLLLVLVPLGWLSHKLDWSPTATFVLVRSHPCTSPQ